VDDSGLTRARPARSRPHWWAVLAVSLSLLALVAARSADPRSTHGHVGRSHATAALGTRSSLSPPVTGGHTSTVDTAAPAPTVTTSTTTTTVATAPVVSSGSSSVRPAATHTSSSTTTTVATSTAPAPPPVPTETYTGDLQQPDDSQATYSFTGSGPMQVSVSWSGPYTLSLSVSCPSGTQNQEGASAFTVVIPDGTGACVTTVRETQMQYNEIPYTLTIGPASGG
jgi:hypothetical protein